MGFVDIVLLPVILWLTFGGLFWAGKTVASWDLLK